MLKASLRRTLGHFLERGSQNYMYMYYMTKSFGFLLIINETHRYTENGTCQRESQDNQAIALKVHLICFT